MKKILLSSLLAISLFGHGEVLHNNQINEAKSYDYGFFFNTIYKNKDLYPSGITQAQGYENHGETDKIEVEHYGIFANGNINNFIYDIEINRHIDSPRKSNDMIEKLSFGYKYDELFLKAGRDYNEVSFIDSKDWGYGFINMPLALDSFFNKTLRADGVFAVYDNDKLRVSGDLSKDIYDNKNRKTLKASYDFGTLEVISYVQGREIFETKNDFSLAQHSHTHGTQDSGCSSLTSSEVCFENESLVFGTGAKVEFEKFEILGEYLNLKSDGQIKDNRYKIEHDTQVESVYLQIFSKNEQFNYGFRSEIFWFDKELIGLGATSVASKMGLSSKDEREQYLHTLGVNYKIDNTQKVFMDNSYDGDSEFAIKFNYIFRFSMK